MYQKFLEEKNYSQELQNCIESTVTNLQGKQIGMLLGKIQSGKTKAFIGIIAKAFAKDFDLCCILTKGTNVLVEQTKKRLEAEYKTFINRNEIQVFDIMNVKTKDKDREQKLNNFQIDTSKLIFVVKKEKTNLTKLYDLFDYYEQLKNKKVLIIDDEADYGGIGFKKRQGEIEINRLPEIINNLRTRLSEENYRFLQVTATPYSLYLQPQEEVQVNNGVQQVLHPEFTELVPVHDRYIGGKQYFEYSQTPDIENFEIYSNLYVNVPLSEISAINSKKQDSRLLNNILGTPSFSVLRRMLINYIVGGTIRILQEGNPNYRTCAILHTSPQIMIHRWQEKIFRNLIDKLKDSIKQQKENIKQMIQTSYEELKVSVSGIPDYSEVEKKVIDCIGSEYIDIVTVNSDSDVYAHINQDTGQLRLDNLFNIFIGGNVLDRGLTFDNLIAFYYGREVRQFQEDTVLQHSRIYGARAIKDLAVTRLYTSQYIYDALVNIHQFDAALWNAFEQNPKQDVVFLEKDKSGTVKPCASNKILISKTRTLKPFARFLPVEFVTKANTHIQKNVSDIEAKLNEISNNNFKEPFLLDICIATLIIEQIKSTFKEDDNQWDKIMKAVISRVNDNVGNDSPLKNKIYCLVRVDRQLSRYKDNNSTLSDAPDGGQQDLVPAKAVATETACLILIKQKGEKSKGWMDAPFWWPVLITPENTKTAIFATETNDDNE